ncbi:MAG: hypothetical protein RR063_10665, partial [Anaerovoracaceae bacterium]
MQAGKYTQQRELTNHVKHEKSNQPDFYVRLAALFVLHKNLPRCRSPPLVLRFRPSTKIKEDKKM